MSDGGSFLPLWSPAAQMRCLVPDARAPDLFVFLHGMLFTNIQLDDFSLSDGEPVLPLWSPAA